MSKRIYGAQTRIVFPNLAAYLDEIVASVVTHGMTIEQARDGFAVRSAFGSAWLAPGSDVLDIRVESEEPTSLNRLKHALTGPITFIARAENLHVAWEGDRTGPTLPGDLRVLTVTASRLITPRQLRISFRGEDLGRFDVADQIHGRLLFQPRAEGPPEWPMLDDDGTIVWPASGRLASRVYTIRRIDAVAGSLDIDFALHDNPGPATRWAIEARPGDVAGILGPAAGTARPAGFSILLADDTGLPGIARILETMPSEARGIALIEVADSAEVQELVVPEGVELIWLLRDGRAPGTTALLPDAARAALRDRPATDVFVWGGCEFRAFRDLHRLAKIDLALPPARRVLYPHWRRGMSEDDIVKAGASVIAA